MMEELGVAEFDAVSGGQLSAFDDYLIALGGGMFAGAEAGAEYGALAGPDGALLGGVAGAVYGGVDATADYGLGSFMNSWL